MPRHRQAKKDVVSCVKPRGGAHNLRSGDIRMGQPGAGNAASPCVSGGQTGGTETSKYPQEEKVTTISSVAASERERA